MVTRPCPRKRVRISPRWDVIAYHKGRSATGQAFFPNCVGRRPREETGAERMQEAEAFFGLGARVAIVTGGGRGIGEAVCRRLAAAGARIAVIDRDGVRARAVAASLSGLGLAGDVTSPQDIARCLSEVEQGLGPPAILVNNAGITGKAGRLWDLTQ